METGLNVSATDKNMSRPLANCSGVTSKFAKGDWYFRPEMRTGGTGDELDFLPGLNMEEYRLQRRNLLGQRTRIGPSYKIKEVLDKILEMNIDIMIRRAGHIEDVHHIANCHASCL